MVFHQFASGCPHVRLRAAAPPGKMTWHSKRPAPKLATSSPGYEPRSRRPKVGELRKSVAGPRSNEGWCRHTRLERDEELRSAMECKGMVQFGGTTYRIVKLY